MFFIVVHISLNTPFAFLKDTSAVVIAEANYEKASRPLGPKLSKVLA
ncbi:hypothetical protein [Clostridium sp.]|nr:hypothetical protein [Clostridium sp.]